MKKKYFSFLLITFLFIILFSRFYSPVFAALSATSLVGTASLVNGTASAPSMSFYNSPSAGLYLSATNVIGFSNPFAVSGTSTFYGGTTISGLQTTSTLGFYLSTISSPIMQIGTNATTSVGIATSSPSTGVLEIKGDIFYKGQAYSEWTPMTNTAPATIADCSIGDKFSSTISLAINIISFKNCKSGQTAKLRIQEDSTGGRLINWATSTPIVVNGQYASTTANAVNWFDVSFFGNYAYITYSTATNPTN